MKIRRDIRRKGRTVLLPENDSNLQLIRENLMGVEVIRGSSEFRVMSNLFNEVAMGELGEYDNIYSSPQQFDETKLHPDLKEYQIADIKKMVRLDACLNRNTMGYGKTAEAIHYAKIRDCKKILIVAPKSVLLQWKCEIDKWWPDNTNKIEICPNKVDDSTEICIINYEKLDKDIFDKLEWDLIVADEAHRVKNYTSKRAKKMQALKSKCRLALTGTPVTNKPNDLYGILLFLSRFYAGLSYWNFVNHFCEVRESFYGKEIVGLTRIESRIELLKKTLDIISIHNPDLMLTPGKEVVDIAIEMSDKQKKMYKNIKNLILEQIPEDMPVSNGLTKVIRLQQLTTNPYLLGIEDNPKFEWIKEYIEDTKSQYEKIVIFSKFASTVASLRMFLERPGNGCSNGDLIQTITGDTELRDIQLKKFITGCGRVLIGTIGAIGMGVDGLQLASSTIIFLDRDWSPAMNEQAEDRLNRLGQKKRVTVYRLSCKDTIDEKVGRVLLKKSSDIRAMLED